MEVTKIKHTCPVCGYEGLNEPVRGEKNEPSFEICPSCGVEFGFDDYDSSCKILGEKWFEGGAYWQSRTIQKPKDWDGRRQYNRFLKESKDL